MWLAASVSGASASFLPLARTMVLPLASLLPSRASQPSTVTESPTFIASLVHPAVRKSSGLAHSTAQFDDLAACVLHVDDKGTRGDCSSRIE